MLLEKYISNLFSNKPEVEAGKLLLSFLVFSSSNRGLGFFARLPRPRSGAGFFSFSGSRLEGTSFSKEGTSFSTPSSFPDANYNNDQ